jgi:transposase
MSRDSKYIGMDVHKEAIVIAVLDGSGKLVMESIVETKASSILQFIHGLRGELHVTWEEGTWAAWLYDLLQPQVAQVLVCDPRRNALLKEGNKSDKVDARKLADLLRTGMLRPVYHGEHGLRTLRELGRSYQTLSQDLNRVMNRIKALYRGWSIPCAGTQVDASRYREEWLQEIEHAGVRRRAELLYQQLDGLQALRRTLRPELLAESRKHKAARLLRQIPCIGPIRAARLIALMQTPHRFRSKRQLWTYSGLGIETRDSAQYRYVRGQLQRTFTGCGSTNRSSMLMVTARTEVVKFGKVLSICWQRSQTNGIARFERNDSITMSAQARVDFGGANQPKGSEERSRTC